MSQNVSLRYAAKKIYQENSQQISDSYELEGLKKISVIYLPQDAPSWVRQIAYLLQRTVSQKYEDCTPEIVITLPLFDGHPQDEDYLNMLFKNISDNLKARHSLPLPSNNFETLILCEAPTAVALLKYYGKAIDDYGKEHLPSLLLDVRSFRINQERPLDEVAHLIGVAPAVIEGYSPYVRKIYRQADFLIAYAGGFESWQDLIYAWHENCRLYGKAPKIIFVDDLRRWTSGEYSAKIFHKFCKLLQRLRVKDALLLNIASAHPQLILDTVGEKRAIIFVPQLKTYCCSDFRIQERFANQISFGIYEKLFEEYWENNGQIGRQFFCQELSEFLTGWNDDIYQQRGYQFYQLFRHRRFKNWNLKFYWWNFKIRLGNICRQVYLSEYCLIRDKYHQ